MKGHHKLNVWKRSIDLVTKVYDTTSSFPEEEIYGLSSQIRRASVSIPSNIAEGAERNSNKEFIQFLSFAQGSIAGLETQLIISQNLGYVKEGDGVFSEMDEISKMIIGLQKRLRQKSRYSSLATRNREGGED